MPRTRKKPSQKVKKKSISKSQQTCFPSQTRQTPQCKTHVLYEKAHAYG